MIKRLISIATFAIAALVSTTTFANTGLTSDAVNSAGFKKLSESQKAEILKKVAEQAAAADNSLTAVVADTATSAPKVDQWLNIGERIGKMIGGAAKEVNLAVNDFVRTPVGMTAMALIVWHYMGDMIVHVFGAMLVLVVGMGYIMYFARRYTYGVTEYDTEKKDMFGRSLIKSVTKTPMDGETVSWFLAATGVVIIAALITMFTY